MSEAEKSKRSRPKYWVLEDLSEEERNEAEGICKEGQLYFGDPPIAAFKVFECPLCSKRIHVEEFSFYFSSCQGWKFKKCKHMVFCYDATNGEYVYFNRKFKIHTQ